MGGMRGVGLVLIDPRRGRIHGFLNIVRRPQDAVRTRLILSSRHGHEVGRAARDEQRVIRLQRHDDRAAAALRHEVETVVEELSEERKHQVERRSEAEVGCDVRDEERPGNGIGRHRGRAHEAARAARIRRSGSSGRVGCRLVDDQVGDDARLRVNDRGVRLRRVRGARFRWTETRLGQTRKELIRGTEEVLIGYRDNVVERPIDSTQTDWKLRVGEAAGCAGNIAYAEQRVDLVWSGPEERAASRVGLGDFDLVMNEPQITGVDRKSVSDRCDLRLHGSHRVQSQQQKLVNQEHVEPFALGTHSHKTHLHILQFRF